MRPCIESKRTAATRGSRRGDDGWVTNRLAEETSPYLLQHKDNPVAWFPWGDEALGKARAEDKP
ncbi:MAG TPA: DUF255 domain-containing protein, partial [Tepidiformaceae bacterium]|nr:DUF255 domain-containing protein [Tepidiformaceae bacterium]